MAARSGAMKAFVFFIPLADRVNGQGSPRVIVQIIISRCRCVTIVHVVCIMRLRVSTRIVY